MKEQLLFDDFPTKEQRLAAMTEEEKAAYILGMCCYDGETGNGAPGKGFQPQKDSHGGDELT